MPAIPAARLLMITGYLAAAFACGPQLADAAEFPQKIREKAEQATVRIFALQGPDDGSMGTGFFITSQGHVVTNHHVTTNSPKVLVLLPRGDKLHVLEARKVADLPSKDLAIFKVSPPFAVSHLGLSSRPASRDQSVMSIGYPGVLDAIFSPSNQTLLEETGNEGVLRITRQGQDMYIPSTFRGSVGREVAEVESGFGGSFRGIVHNAKISEGNSGGPLIDRAGNVIGINAQGRASDFGIDYAVAIHASELIQLCRQHRIAAQITSRAPPTGHAAPWLWFLLILLLMIMAVALMKKPRTVMVEAMSRAVNTVKPPRPQPVVAHTVPPRPPGQGVGYHLRGRDRQGNSYHLAFSAAEFARNGGRLVIGRKSDLCSLVIANDSVSRQHATLTLLDGHPAVEDRNSGNGTLLNGRELGIGTPPQPVRPGDRLTLGEVELVLDASP